MRKYMTHITRTKRLRGGTVFFKKLLLRNYYFSLIGYANIHLNKKNILIKKMSGVQTIVSAA